MGILLPDKKVSEYRWTKRRIGVAAIFVFVLMLVFGFMLSNVDADEGFKERQRDRLAERLLKAEEDEAQAAKEQAQIMKKILRTLQKIEQKME